MSYDDDDYEYESDCGGVGTGRVRRRHSLSPGQINWGILADIRNFEDDDYGEAYRRFLRSERCSSCDPKPEPPEPKKVPQPITDEERLSYIKKNPEIYLDPNHHGTFLVLMEAKTWDDFWGSPRWVVPNYDKIFSMLKKVGFSESNTISVALAVACIRKGGCWEVSEGYKDGKPFTLTIYNGYDSVSCTFRGDGNNPFKGLCFS